MALIERDDGGQTISEEDWSPVLLSLKEGFFREHKENLTSLHLDRLLTTRSALKIDDSGVEDKLELLYRADVFFQCLSCSRFQPRSMCFPSSASHSSCQRNGVWRCFLELESADREYPSCSSVLMAFARKLLSQMNIPLTITMAELESRGDIFVCLCCEPEIRKKMSWMNLVSSSRYSLGHCAQN